MNQGLALLRQPFQKHQISLLPKPTKKDNQKGKCEECGGWHGLPAIHLEYVGHAALTDRLLDADPHWSWEPLAYHEGLPAFDKTGGLWIKLTVCGVTRLGYGHAKEKEYNDIGSREKEVIGDALRNAAMRFGAALDLWHKGDLKGEEDNGTSGISSTVVTENNNRYRKSDSVIENFNRTAIAAADSIGFNPDEPLPFENNPFEPTENPAPKDSTEDATVKKESTFRKVPEPNGKTYFLDEEIDGEERITGGKHVKKTFHELMLEDEANDFNYARWIMRELHGGNSNMKPYTLRYLTYVKQSGLGGQWL